MTPLVHIGFYMKVARGFYMFFLYRPVCQDVRSISTIYYQKGLTFLVNVRLFSLLSYCHIQICRLMVFNI